MKKGAADFLLKPFDREEILFTVRKPLAARATASRTRRPQRRRPRARSARDDARGASR